MTGYDNGPLHCVNCREYFTDHENKSGACLFVPGSVFTAHSARITWELITEIMRLPEGTTHRYRPICAMYPDAIYGPIEYWAALYMRHVA